MNTNVMDIDPLSQYECPQYSTYQPAPFPHIPHPYYTDYNPPQYIPSVPTQPCSVSQVTEPSNTYHELINQIEPQVTNEPPPEEEDVKPDITTLNLKCKRNRKLRGKTSNYWNKKITDKNFKFYGCSVCNISFQELSELDSHVTIHSNRITSYDIRIQNMKKRKRLKKEKKKKKKDAKIKKELDIKPEDGYIGTETADQFKGEINENGPVTENKDVKKDENDANKGNTNNDVVTNGSCKNSDDKTNVNGEINDNLKGKKNEVYKCFACNKQFALSYYLKIHVRSHTDEKPYTCNYCGLTFITASKMGRHKKRIHLAVRNQCRICYKFFSRFELLTKHFDKKHADQKLEGEPYDYNAILPYLTELEEQLKNETEDKKPKREDPWEVEWKVATADQDTKVEPVKDEKENKETVVPVKFEFADDTGQKIEEFDPNLEVKDEEPETSEEQASQVFENIYEPDQPSSDEDIFKDDGAPSDDEEYFPPGTWATSPPRSVAPPQSPAPRRKGPPVCQLCDRTFSSKSYLKVHLRTHTGEKPFSCYVCGRGFITASKMHRHVLTHDETWVGEDKIKPEGAIKSEEDEEEEDIVDKEKKQKKSKAKIDKAKQKFMKKTSKKLDPKLKIRSRPHNCEYCGKKFLHLETLQVHQKCHEGEELVYKCLYCLEPQLDLEARAEHEASHTGPKPYLCTLCGRHYKDRGAMIYHRKNHKPNDEKSLICDICSKRFNTQTKLQRHIVSHSSEKFVLRYECPVCANMFHTRWHVQMHLKSHQKEGLILEENRNAVLAMVLQNARKIPKTSDGQLPTPSTNTQMDSQPDERSRICNICGQVFQHFYYLEEHLKTHGSRIAVEDLDKEDDKKYTCQVCSKSFKLHYYLKLHSFTHTKEKPFICQQCGKGFITKGKLKRHLETHQGLKKYQCHICYKFFTRPGYLRIHVRTIHGTQDYNFRDYSLGVPIGLGVLGQVSDNV